MSEIALKINGKSVKAKEGITILEAARGAGISIPTLCHHKKLAPYGACRLCMVEIVKRGRAQLVASCVYQVAEGLEVETESLRVIRFRKLLLELMLANAPEAKPIQRYAKQYGVNKIRFQVDFPNPCILCGRCVRYCAEVKKANAIGFVGRGQEQEVVFLTELAVNECPTCKKYLACPTQILQSIYKSQVELRNEQGN